MVIILISKFVNNNIVGLYPYSISISEYVISIMPVC